MISSVMKILFRFVRMLICLFWIDYVFLKVNGERVVNLVDVVRDYGSKRKGILSLNCWSRG